MYCINMTAVHCTCAHSYHPHVLHGSGYDSSTLSEYPGTQEVPKAVAASHAKCRGSSSSNINSSINNRNTTQHRAKRASLLLLCLCLVLLLHMLWRLGFPLLAVCLLYCFFVLLACCLLCFFVCRPTCC